MTSQKSSYFVENENGNCRLCSKPDVDDNMVACDECDRWFHMLCVGLKKSPTESEEWICIKCRADRARMNATRNTAGQDSGMLELARVLHQNSLQMNLQNKKTTLNSLPYFDGRSRDWPKFKKSFEETTKEADFSALENLNRLQRSLKGEAEHAVRALLLDPANIAAIMTRLEQHFGRPAQVYNEMLRDILKVRVDNQFKILELADAIENLVTNVKVMNKHSYLNDPRLIDDVIAKLSTEKQVNWTQYSAKVEEDKGQVTLEDLNSWISQIAASLRTLPKRNDRHRFNLHKPERFRTRTDESKKNVTSKLNVTAPMISSTPRHTPNVNQRPGKEQKQLMCPRCNGNHPANQCSKPKNRLSTTRNELTMNAYQSTSRTTPNSQQQQLKQVYFQIVPVTLRNGKRTCETFAFLDTGSSLSLLDEDTAKKLELSGEKDPLIMTWTQNLTVEQEESRRVRCSIKGKDGTEYSLTNVRTVKNLQLPDQTVYTNEIINRHPYLKGIRIDPQIDAHPTVLIGLDHSHLLMPLERKMGKPNEPMAIRTKLGWMIFGNEHIDTTAPHHFMIHKNEELMNDMIRQYLSTEDFGVKNVKTVKTYEEERAQEIIDSTLKKTNGRYEVGLLWKYDHVSFPNSYRNALTRLSSLEKQLQKNPELQTWAKQTFADYVSKGYLRKLQPAEAVKRSTKTFYLPHFVVVNRNKPVPKPRLVFDAAAKVNNVSLNSQLLSGPDEMASLFGVLVRFREGEICVVGDIKEMFHQVKVRLDDQDAQRILWRDFEDREPDTYVMQVMTFGATCSPALAQKVKNINAQEHAETHPLAIAPLVRQHYVDDYLDSFFTMDEAVNTVKQVMEVHDDAGFHIRNFTSNRRELLLSIPKERRQAEKTVISIEDKVQAYEKILGVQWNASSDDISYRVKTNVLEDVNKPTKRSVLSFVMSVYDPLGLISHITIHGRLLMRELHMAMEDWDTPIPDQLVTNWNAYVQTVKKAENINIQRQIVSYPYEALELHTFVDASENAFAACVYARSISKDGFTVRLIAAKARVAPIKSMSIPRLELQAALLGVRLTDTIRKELRLPTVGTIFWSDSQTVLAWINSNHRKYHQFVAHRVSEILDYSTVSQWRWVPTKHNPADIATKPVDNDEMWFNGPTFLQQSEENWPQKETTSVTEEEIRFVATHRNISSVVPEDHYSSWERLLAHTTYLKKFIDFLKDKKNFSKVITLEDTISARNTLYRKAQWEGFPEEIAALEKGEQINRASCLNKLSPFLDEKGILRSRGRLEAITCLPSATRMPIILPQKPRIVKLIVRHYHEINLHQADNVVIADLRQRFWIINLRAVLKNVKACCQTCILKTATPKAPMMAPLPDFRARPYEPAFTHTGVDYFGPIEVAVRRSTEKRWGAIFTCMSTRAVHIELAEKLDTDSFIVCLKNLQHRRGKISHLYSDNGTNFVGAEKELSQIVRDIDNRMGKEAALRYEIQWSFNPPAAPHFGGSWERLIQTVKKALRFMFQQWNLRKPTPETLRATLIQIEAMLNSRPLTHIPVNTEESEILTPFHFLIGRAVNEVPPIAEPISGVSRKQWKLVQHNAKIYWDRWKGEYLPTLIRRNKWTNKIEPLKVDDIVVLTDDNTPSGRWLKGRIVQVFKAADGQVRSVEVRVGNTVLKRPAVKVAAVDVVQKEHCLVNSSRKRKAPPKQHHEDSKVIREPVTRPRIAPCSWAHKLLFLNTMLAVTCSSMGYSIQPMSGGLVFDHIGTCYIQRGIITRQFETNILPRQDIGRMHHLRFDLERLYKQVNIVNLPDNTLRDAIFALKQETRDIEKEIRRITLGNGRKKRSGGLLGMLKGMLIGGDEVEEELHRMQNIEEVQNKRLFGTLHQLDDRTNSMAGKFINTTKELDRRITKATQEAKMLENRATVMEHLILARQIIESIAKKYEMLQNEPFSQGDLSKTHSEIEKHLPLDSTILKEVPEFGVRELNNRIVISLTVTIVHSDSFEIFHAYPVPETTKNEIIVLKEAMIAVDQKQRHFVPKDLHKINVTHYLASQPIFDTVDTCVSGKLFQKNIKCEMERLPKVYAEFVHMRNINSVLYYTNDVKEINLTCEGKRVILTHHSGLIDLSGDCLLKTKHREVRSSAVKPAKFTRFFSRLSEKENEPSIQMTDNHIIAITCGTAVTIISVISVIVYTMSLKRLKLKQTNVRDIELSRVKKASEPEQATEEVKTPPVAPVRIKQPFRPRKQ